MTAPHLHQGTPVTPPPPLHLPSIHNIVIYGGAMEEQRRGYREILGKPRWRPGPRLPLSWLPGGGEGQPA